MDVHAIAGKPHTDCKAAKREIKRFKENWDDFFEDSTTVSKDFKMKRNKKLAIEREEFDG